jgi:DNA polymerase I-like protein with 3'-5' exonuclease and polymerase domains
VAAALGITVAEAEKFQRIWFSAHPGILRWHRRIEAELTSSRSVTNKFGYRRVYFDRIEQVFTQALAWIPQSTVALVINKGLLQAIRAFPREFIPLLQVHDSLVFQVPAKSWRETLKTIHPHLLHPVPYPQPLTIQLGLKVSERSWGDCEDIKWTDL